MLNAHQTISGRMHAAEELIAHCRSAVAALLALAAIFVVSRRLTGALESPLGPFPLLAAGLVLAGFAQIAHPPARTGRFRAGDALITLATLAIAASFWLPGCNIVALLGFLAVVAGEEFWAWHGMLPSRRASSPLPNSGEGQGVRTELAITSSPSLPPAHDDLIEEPEPVSDVLQQLTLCATAEGGRDLSGWLRLPLVAGQRSGILHVAFCPSFAQSPQVQAEAVSGPDSRVKVAQVLPYGARLDVKLDEPAAPGQNVLIWFHAAIE